jgi:hypothetical protein
VVGLPRIGWLLCSGIGGWFDPENAGTDASSTDGIQVRQIVLGAWGCGAFGNDANEIAGLFERGLQKNFKGAYQRLIFAIVDWSAEKRFIGPFQRIFLREAKKSRSHNKKTVEK